MRLLLATALLAISITASGQKKSLLGKYTHSSFMYRYFLTLGDSGKFIIEEHSDSGLRKTTGTWTITGQLIKLIPSKCISDWGNQRGEVEEFPLEFLEKESLITVGKRNKLTRIIHEKNPGSLANSIEYKLTKIPK